VPMIGSAADADAGGLTESQGRKLKDGLIGERSGSADQADGPRLVNVAGHDADLALVRA